MRTFLALIVCSLLSISTQARQLNEKEALQRASEFLSHPTGKKAPASNLSSLRLSYVAKDASSTHYYVFNRDNNKGFVIASADDRLVPVLGYSDNGNIDMNNLPDNVRYWMEEYSRQIEWVYAHPQDYATVYQAPSRTTYADIEPLVTTKWNQRSPYNNMCPPLNGKTTLTGCGNTAVAQIMKSFNYPEKGKGSITYQNWDETLSVSFEGVSYNWDEMLDVYGSEATAAEIEAVATLMFHVGASIKTQFGPYASSSKTTDVRSALIEHFSYDHGMRLTDRDLYTPEDFESLLIDELSNGRPILYTGVSDSGVGHAFILDGINSSGMVHINWGWGPGWGGYYELSAFDPAPAPGYFGEKAEGYNHHHQLLIGIQPDKGNPSPKVEIFSRSDFTISEEALNGVHQFVFPAKFDIWTDIRKGIWNLSSGDGDFTFALKFVDMKGGQEYIVESSNPDADTFHIPYDSKIESFPNYYNAFLLPEGNYKVYPVYSTPSVAGWNALKTYVNNRAYIYASIESGLVTYYNEKVNENPIIPAVPDYDPLIYSYDEDTLTASITGISPNAKLDCLAIPSIKTYEGKDYTITAIGDYAFGYKDLTMSALELPETLVSIGAGAFSNCDNFKGDLIIPNSVVKIDKYAFYNCSGFDGNLTLPKQLTYLGESAFAGCKGFKGSLVVPEGITTIRERVFQYCSGFDGTLALPANITEIWTGAFENCSGLSGNLHLPASVKLIGSSAFANCIGFSGNLDFRYNNDLRIEHDAFYGCTGFTHLYLPEGRSAGDGETYLRVYPRGFYGCSGLSGRLVIPNINSGIGDYAFEGCNSLSDIMYLSSAEPGIDAFPADKIIRVRCNCSANFYDSNLWGHYEKRYIIGDANFNGQLNVSDAVAVSNYILGKENVSFDFTCADLNFDERISITDVSSIIRALFYTDLSLWDNSTAQMKAPSNRKGIVRLDWSTSKEKERREVCARLESEHEYVGMQTDIQLEDGIEIDDIRLAPHLVESHTLSFAKIANGTTRVIVFSPSSLPIPRRNDAVFTISLKDNCTNISSLVLLNTIASAENAEDDKLEFRGGDNPAISDVDDIVNGNVKIRCVDGKIMILNAVGCHAHIIDIAGRNIASLIVTSESETIALQPGIYIVNVNGVTFKIVL